MKTIPKVLGIGASFVLVVAVAAGQNVGNCTTKEDSTAPDCARAIAFFEQLQAAVKANKRAEVATMISYPITILDHSKQLTLANERQLLAHYDLAFNSSIRCAIDKATTSQVWGNYQGFTFDRGEIWWDGIIPAGEKPDLSAKDSWTKYPFKVITINNEGVLMNGCPSWPPDTRH